MRGNLKASPLKLGTGQGCLLSPLLFNTVQHSLARAGIEGLQTGMS